jgi:hypothetical protein
MPRHGVPFLSYPVNVELCVGKIAALPNIIAQVHGIQFAAGFLIKRPLLCGGHGIILGIKLAKAPFQ